MEEVNVLWQLHQLEVVFSDVLLLLVTVASAKNSCKSAVVDLDLTWFLLGFAFQAPSPSLCACIQL